MIENMTFFLNLAHHVKKIFFNSQFPVPLANPAHVVRFRDDKSYRFRLSAKIVNKKLRRKIIFKKTKKTRVERI